MQHISKVINTHNHYQYNVYRTKINREIKHPEALARYDLSQESFQAPNDFLFSGQHEISKLA